MTITEEGRELQLKRLADELKRIEDTETYYAATLLGVDGGRELSFQSHFAGFPEGYGPEDGVELRAASPVKAHVMANLWDDLGQGWIAVTARHHLAIFLRFGGNALVAAPIAEEFFPERLAPSPCIKPGMIGFGHSPYDSRVITQGRPTPKLRMRVLMRDGARCQLCGERPAWNEHIVLHVHHIRPRSAKGLTHEDNLITLCHTCHDGLDPHRQLGLYFLPGGQVDRALARQERKAFWEGVERYRAGVAAALERYGKKDLLSRV